jgi:chorismate lyase/3-hydroxybenzoate synthase
LCYAEDGDHIAGCLTIAEERCSDGLAALTERAYRDILRFQRESNYQHIWRMWNFVSDINTGIGDTERYRQFCLGRAQAFAAFSTDPLTSGFPAASAVGKRDSPRTLQVCWIASRHRASVVENPRQVSAFDYPRQYGPASPSFSRATVSPERLLLVSGTASIVGHESKHQGDLAAQIDETFRNLDALASDATDKRLIDALPFGRTTLVKAYLKDAGAASWVKDEIKRRLGPDGSPMILAADICRSELLIEIELVHQG